MGILNIFMRRSGLPWLVLAVASEANSAQPPSLPAAASSMDSYSLPSGVSRGSFRAPLKPAQDVPLSARAAGIVEVIHVAEGSLVKAGQSIISLDSDQESADVAQTEAQLRGAKANRDRTAAEFARNQQIGSDLVTPKQLLETKTQAEVAQSGYEQAQAALKAAQVRLSNRDVKSPIDGIFLKTNKVVGESVERYETVARVVDVSSLEMIVYCDSQYFSLFHTGQKVDVQVLKPIENQPIVPGIVSHVDPIVDPISTTFRVKIKIERSEQAVPGLFAKLIAPTG